MKILIPDIPKEGLDIEVEEALQYEAISSPVKARLRVERLGTEIIVNGALSAETRLQCSRCLKEFTQTLSVPIEVVYRPVEDLKGDERHEVAAGELDMDFYSGEELDLSALLKEQIMLNIDMKPLCGDLCRGICSGCGADLSVECCRCGGKDVDPRLAKLKKLLQ